jgi:hypothetical protein
MTHRIQADMYFFSHPHIVNLTIFSASQLSFGIIISVSVDQRQQLPKGYSITNIQRSKTWRDQ